MLFRSNLGNNSADEKSHEAFYKSRKAFAHKRLPKEQRVDQFALYVIDDTAAILSLNEKDLVGIKITNKHIAENFKQLFDALWQKKKAKK